MSGPRRSDGFTLIESLVAISILGIALAGILPSFLTYLDTNTASEERSDAVAAAQQVMETLREQEPAGLPTSGSSAVQIIPVGIREYEVVTHYCVNSSLCGTDSRHLVVEVLYGGRAIYSLESVFARLR